jgi:hypothetical protein
MNFVPPNGLVYHKHDTHSVCFREDSPEPKRYVFMSRRHHWLRPEVKALVDNREVW